MMEFFDIAGAEQNTSVALLNTNVLEIECDSTIGLIRFVPLLVFFFSTSSWAR
jgi:hypothetical protein